jgi:hypothetical protein
MLCYFQRPAFHKIPVLCGEYFFDQVRVVEQDDPDWANSKMNDITIPGYLSQEPNAVTPEAEKVMQGNSWL